MTHRAFACATAAFSLLASAGCVRSLPTYTWVNSRTAIDVMTTRDADIDSFSATFRLLLQSGAGEIELTAVIVAQPPDNLRLRAWKFSQSVFDITLNPNGLFIFSKSNGQEGGMETERLTRDGLIEATAMLPGFFGEDGWRNVDDVDQDYFHRSRPIDKDGNAMRCTVEKLTLTTTRCDFLDESGVTRHSLRYSDYRAFGEALWPMRIEGVGPDESFKILFDRVELNPELSPRAFIPPRRAVKQP